MPDLTYSTETKLVELDNDAEVLLSIISQLPTAISIDEIIKAGLAADKRGYMQPSEEDNVLFVYSAYLKNRAFLLDIMWRCQEIFNDEANNVESEEGSFGAKVFAVGFLAALTLKRAGFFIIEIAQSCKVIRKKLDQAEVSFGLERKSFASLYKSLTSPAHSIAFHEALRFYKTKRFTIEDTLDGIEFYDKIVKNISEEYAKLDYKKRVVAMQRLYYRLFSLHRRSFSGYAKVMFQLFKISGSHIAELKQPHIAKQHKDVCDLVIQSTRLELQPGDVIITRHHDALSNLFLPGYWPHGAFYVGNAEQRLALGCKDVSTGFDIVEAKKDGVKKRLLDETLHVDEFVVLRCIADKDKIKHAVDRAISEVGKGYDFVFDFSDTERLVCTEVVYRAYEPAGVVSFILSEKAGRMCLPAESLIKQCLNSGYFTIELLYRTEQGELYVGEKAREAWYKWTLSVEF